MGAGAPAMLMRVLVAFTEFDHAILDMFVWKLDRQKGESDRTAARVASNWIPNSMNLVNGPMSAFFAVSAALMVSGFTFTKLYLKK